MLKKTHTKLPLFLVIFFALIWFKSYISIDPDFGWRLSTGYRIISSGVPKTDTYSYTMPSFPWVDHAWFSDVLFAFLYSNVGYLGLSSFIALLTVSAIYLSLLAAKSIVASTHNNKRVVDKEFPIVVMPIVILVCTSFLKFTGVRAQTWTWFFLACILNIIFDKNLWSKYKKFVPLFFLAWANLHGGFAAGLIILIIFVLSRCLDNKKILFDELLVVFVSFLATLLNPYIFGIYREVWSSISDKDLEIRVMEWNSLYKSFNFAPMFLMLVSSVFIFMYRARLGVGKVLMFILMLYESISSVRQVPLFSLLSLPLGTLAILLFFDKISSNKESGRRFNKLFSYFLGLTMIIFAVETAISIKASYSLSERLFYPKSAITFLKENPPNGNVFSEYGWGGYIIWKFPEKKVFIDGRMPSWKRSQFSGKESGDAMKDYMGIISGDVSYRDIFDKYDIDSVIWSQKKKKGYIDLLEEKYFNQLGPLYKVLGKKQVHFDLLDKLESDGWNVIFSDNVSVILQK